MYKHGHSCCNIFCVLQEAFDSWDSVVSSCRNTICGLLHSFAAGKPVIWCCIIAGLSVFPSTYGARKLASTTSKAINTNEHKIVEANAQPTRYDARDFIFSSFHDRILPRWRIIRSSCSKLAVFFALPSTRTTFPPLQNRQFTPVALRFVRLANLSIARYTFRHSDFAWA